ncbi:ATP-binding protein, partial [Streptomyces sp. NPDC059515]|uniref:ATP-binding protein n=1 Tax=Streptomyces sp. NPDC059515 TaxID=3346854 RepID=UPI0036BCDBC3
MGAIPTQRETTSRAHGAPECARADATLTGSPLAPGSARAVVRAALAEWTGLALPGTEHLTGRAGDDAELIASELVTNAVVHAGTDLRLTCRLEEGTGALIVEVRDRHPSRAPRGDEPETAPHHTLEYGRGLRLVAALCDAWGVTYRPGEKTVWARLPPGGRPEAAGIEAYAAEVAPAHDLSLARMLATGTPTPTATPMAAGQSERSAPPETGPRGAGGIPAGPGPGGRPPTPPRGGR